MYYSSEGENKVHKGFRSTYSPIIKHFKILCYCWNDKFTYVEALNSFLYTFMATFPSCTVSSLKAIFIYDRNLTKKRTLAQSTVIFSSLWVTIHNGSRYDNGCHKILTTHLIHMVRKWLHLIFDATDVAVNGYTTHSLVKSFTKAPAWMFPSNEMKPTITNRQRSRELPRKY